MERSPLIYSRKRMASISESQKQKKEKLKGKFAEHRVKERQTRFNNQKTASAKEASTKKQIEVGMKQSHELHHPFDKLCRSSGKNTVQLKKDFKGTNADVLFDKSKTNTSQKHNFKSPRRIVEKMKQMQKKSDKLPGKSNTNKLIKLQFLLNLIPKDDCGMLLQSSSANKIDHYKCCRCGKTFRSIKLGSMHYSNCKSSKFLLTKVFVIDIKWVCTICHSSLPDISKLLKHIKECNILRKDYEKACLKRCVTCHFRCISSILFDKHDCAKELEDMKKCVVQLKVVKMPSATDRAILCECTMCTEIFGEEFTDQHFQSHHPGARSSGNFKQYYVNRPTLTNPKPSSDTIVVKSEPVSLSYNFFASSSPAFRTSYQYRHINGYHSPNLSRNHIAMPSPPSINVPTLTSSVNLSANQSSSAQLSSSDTTLGASIINQKFCKCVNHTVGIDAKPCLKCLSQVDITKFAPNFKIVPYELAKIKKETSEDSVALNSSTLVDGSIAAPSAESREVAEMDSGRGLFYFPLLGPYQQSFIPSSTHPSSHGGIGPPAIPNALVQSLMNKEPYSVLDVSIGSLNDIKMVPDISQPDEPRFPEKRLNYFNDCSPVIPLMQGDEFPPVESPIIVHIWGIDNFTSVDTWALVPSEDDETVEKYICSECLEFSCLDQNSILNHLWKTHVKKHEYLAMYVNKNLERFTES